VALNDGYLFVRKAALENITDYKFREQFIINTFIEELNKLFPSYKDEIKIISDDFSQDKTGAKKKIQASKTLISEMRKNPSQFRPFWYALREKIEHEDYAEWNGSTSSDCTTIHTDTVSGLKLPPYPFDD